MRGTVMTEADVVVTVGRRLDFQLAFGSPAVFGGARFVRIADAASELRDNRRGAAEIYATPKAALRALVETAGNREPAVDTTWAAKLHAGHEDRATRLKKSMVNAPPGSDGLMHPNTLIGVCAQAVDAGELTDEERNKLDEHLSACSSCRIS